MIQFLNYKKSYGNFPVLQVPDMTLEAGIYWVKGINGSGKSTLLKSIAGMISCGGDVWIRKEISLKRAPVNYRKVVNFSEADPLFPPFITGFEMIDLFVSAKNGAMSQSEHLVESMNMQSYLQMPVSSYSSGMLKKLSLLLAFLGQPKVILLDEPLITIDVDSLKILYSWIADKYKKEGTTFLITSHQALDSEYLPGTKKLLVAHQTLTAIS